MPEEKDAIKIIGRVTGDDQKLRDMIAEEMINVQIARAIHELRTRAGLTQEQLARLVGTKQPAIARLEDADYGGHSLSMLERIATALHHRMEFRFVPIDDGPAAMAALRRHMPTAYARLIEPAPGMVGVAEPTLVMAYDFFVFASAKVPDEVVYRLTKALFEHKADLVAAVSAFRHFEPEKMSKDVGRVPKARSGLNRPRGSLTRTRVLF